jgi:hypothetical protein
MKQTLTKDMFRFQMNQIRPNNFSYEGQGVLFDYLDDIDTELEFDPIAICCDFSQCSLEEFLDAFHCEQIPLSKDATQEDKKDLIQDYIEMHGFWFDFVEDGKEVIFENF